MNTTIQDIERRQLREVPRFKAGDTVRVHFRVIEGSRRSSAGFRSSSCCLCAAAESGSVFARIPRGPPGLFS